MVQVCVYVYKVDLYMCDSLCAGYASCMMYLFKTSSGDKESPSLWIVWEYLRGRGRSQRERKKREGEGKEREREREGGGKGEREEERGREGESNAVCPTFHNSFNKPHKHVYTCMYAMSFTHSLQLSLQYTCTACTDTIG